MKRDNKDKPFKCLMCEGSGIEEEVACKNCEGEGCEWCDGVGWIEYDCPYCAGEGYIDPKDLYIGEENEEFCEGGLK